MSQIAGGVRVGGFISPTDSTDTYPVTDPMYGIDGWRSVADTTARNAIPSARRREGMIVWVVADGKAYQLKGGITDDKWISFAGGATILNGAGAPSGGTGNDGDFYIDTTANYIYGPKASGVWPSGISLVGPQGIQGSQGSQGSQGPSPTIVGFFTGTIEAPTNKTYTLDLYAVSAYTVDSITIKSSSGTCTVGFQINGVNIGTLNGISVSSTPASLTSIAPKTVQIGQSLTMVVSGVSSTVDLQFTLGTTKGLLDDSIGLAIEAPIIKTYTIDLSATKSYTIDTLYIKLGSGTCTAAIQINGVSVTGMSAVSVTSGLSTIVASGANAVSVGQLVTLVVSAPSLPTDLQLTIAIH